MSVLKLSEIIYAFSPVMSQFEFAACSAYSYYICLIFISFLYQNKHLNEIRLRFVDYSNPLIQMIFCNHSDFVDVSVSYTNLSEKAPWLVNCSLCWNILLEVSWVITSANVDPGFEKPLSGDERSIFAFKLHEMYKTFKKGGGGFKPQMPDSGSTKQSI